MFKNVNKKKNNKNNTEQKDDIKEIEEILEEQADYINNKLTELDKALEVLLNKPINI